MLSQLQTRLEAGVFCFFSNAAGAHESEGESALLGIMKMWDRSLWECKEKGSTGLAFSS